ncbi:hypothetical protein O1611_g5952 [Lasiodiplodia mahajangana]|uniref:Uncharacterized protein n=1 Tax=Lasiodiplodia mahajangana TaxID=1108764 RepID=A0ACC2JJM1_9PEZI|nr:hypothetical protein O1611_g5952 [Lasiodiplodia mahajangana]
MSLIKLPESRRQRTSPPSEQDGWEGDVDPIGQYSRSLPVSPGDQLKDGRYKILCQLALSGLSTTWAARDQMEHRYVAVRIFKEEESNTREINVSRTISNLPKKTHPGQQHIVQFFDNFGIKARSGQYQCLILELLGPTVFDLVAKAPGKRLSAAAAKRIAYQVLQAIDFLAQNGIAHGDIHTSSLALVIPGINSIPEQEFLEIFGELWVGKVESENLDIKLIGFGESFYQVQPPATLHSSLSARPPEVIFGDRMDCQVDMWSMGCLLFELFTGHELFPAYMALIETVVAQMVDLAPDKLPGRWEEQWRDMEKKKGLRPLYEGKPPTLHELLEKAYFDRGRHPQLTKQDLTKIGDLIGPMLEYEPSARPSAEKVLNGLGFR